MKWCVSTLFSICILFSLIAHANAETLLETFDTDPTTHGWTNTQCGSTYFTYKPAGYLEAILHRDPTNVARYTTPLSQTYDAYNNPTEFWFGFDGVVLHSHNGIYSESYFGVFNSTSPDNHHNAIVDQFPYRKYMSLLGNRHDIYAFADDGTVKFESGKPSPPWIEAGEPFRVEGHYWVEDGIRKGQISVYHIKVDGSGETGGLIQTATKSYLVQGPLSFNLFGLANRTSGSFGNYHNDMHVDNFYFSTEEPMEDYLTGIGQPRPQPSFLDPSDYAFLFDTEQPVPDETIFEPFDTDPELGNWFRTGSEFNYSYDPDGFVDIDMWSTPEAQRFTTAVSGNYDCNTEFWFEYDWLPVSFYQWPKAYFGVFNDYTGNDQNVIAAYYMFHDPSDDRERFRLLGTSTYGTETWDYAPSYTRPSGQALHARTKMHYYLNDVNEGWLTLEVWDLVSDALLAEGSCKIFEAGHEGGYDVRYNLFGFANRPGDSSSPGYHDRIWADNLYFSSVGPADDYFLGLGQPRPSPSWPDPDPPEPDPMTWASEPSAIKATQVTMTATEAADFNPVQYYFNNITDPNHDSGWQDSNTYIDRHLSDNSEYEYRVKTRDLSLSFNETGWSTTASAITPIETDVNPPTPDPATWAELPNEKMPGAAFMTATEATDPEGNAPIQYYFMNLTDPNHDSGWQYEPNYTDDSLECDTEYSYQVAARDISGNYNQTAWSTLASVTTGPEPPISEYLRKMCWWHFDILDRDLLLRIHYVDIATPPYENAPVIVYCLNLPTVRIGQEPDATILQDLIDEGYIVITVDFYNDPNAVSPDFDEDLWEFFKEVLGYGGRTSPLEGTSLIPDEKYRLWYLPEGYRIERNIPFWETDKHGSYGTLDNIMGHWNTYVVDNYNVNSVSDPNEMHTPDGGPIDYNTYMDIVYPSQTGGVKVPLVYWNGTLTYRNMLIGPAYSRYHFAGFVMRGYAWANPAHCFDPLVYWYGAFPASEMDWWNGLKSNTAFVRYIRKNADIYNIDPNRIGGWGHSKGQYTITRMSDPNHAGGSELRTFEGYPPGTPEPQPWQGYSSQITCGYQSMGLGDDHPEFVTSDYVPTLTVCGDRDYYGHYEPNRWPKLVEKLEQMNVPHTAFLMYDVGHDLPTGYDPVLGIDRYEVTVDFFDRYLKPGQFPPVPLIIKPRHQRANVLPSEKVWINFAPIIDPNAILEGNGIKVRYKSSQNEVSGTWEALNGNTTYQFSPDGGIFAENKSYEIVITTNAKDIHGNFIAEERITEFTVPDIIRCEELAELVDTWLQNVPAGYVYDFDESNMVDFIDYTTFAESWQQPKPASW